MSLSFEKAKVLNPKRSSDTTTNRVNWHDYYAGYSSEFAYAILSSIGLNKESLVMDPWNGAGTTTLAASAIGYKSVGFDLNPVPVIIAKAFKISYGEKPSIVPLLSKIINKFKVINIKYDSNDPLRLWFKEDSSCYIRALERSIQYFLIQEQKGKYVFIKSNVNLVSEIAAFFYLAVFRVVRSLIGQFQSSNPTWVKQPKDEHSKVSIDKNSIRLAFVSEVNAMLENFDPVFDNSANAESKLFIGNSLNIQCEKNSVDFVLSSPPYCTRIDYGVYTMPELCVLGLFKSELDNLRRSLIGSTTVPKNAPASSVEWGEVCNSFLDEVKNHPSISSDTYYLKNHLQYFDLMFSSLLEINRVLKKGGACTLVVQDSYYKDVHNDLPEIISQMGNNLGWSLAIKKEFPSLFNMSGVNPGVKRYRKQTDATESVLVFSK
ncbi:hypothetical protein E5K00_15750 [Hymenobacter aquaticus]|uniref:Uncharacterized protein n=1 Tax=Hymenobacter aquaticus TaxID=1867101 RepID=A0A4Z0PW71_9BACT|nr:hypothetical protein [Hymenobacter aquaticus]TGE21725.1 hypothetical protein E5K00_15750 [Hymenobacter aquaticus]